VGLFSPRIEVTSDQSNPNVNARPWIVTDEIKLEPEKPNYQYEIIESDLEPEDAECQYSSDDDIVESDDESNNIVTFGPMV